MEALVMLIVCFTIGIILGHGFVKWCRKNGVWLK